MRCTRINYVLNRFFFEQAVFEKYNEARFELRVR